MKATGFIKNIDKNEGFTLFVPLEKTYLLNRWGVMECEISINDARLIRTDQRRKIYAIISDISLYTGYVPEETKSHMKYDFIAKTGCNYFSLSNCSVANANAFLEHLIAFCLDWDIPCADNLIDRCPDIGRYIYVPCS